MEKIHTKVINFNDFQPRNLNYTKEMIEDLKNFKNTAMGDCYWHGTFGDAFCPECHEEYLYRKKQELLALELKRKKEQDERKSKRN